jgi:predicted nuclease with TOPRIM domain
VVRLRERIEKLEVHKSIKEQRLNEMLEKELRFDSEVKFLKVKNSELEDEVKSLRETIILQTSEKALIGTLNS